MSTSTVQRQKTNVPLGVSRLPLDHLPVVAIGGKTFGELRELAKRRNKSYERIDGGDTYGSHTSVSSHLTGLLGEFAVALLYKETIDTSTYSFGDGGTDLSLWDQTIDVKTTSTEYMRRPELLVRGDSELAAELYCLCHVIEQGADHAKVRVHGFASRDQVARRTPRKHPGQRENYVIPPEELTPPPWAP